MKKKITNRLLDLNELDGVTVTVSGPKKQTVRIQHTRAHVLDYEFTWTSDDHFIGYVYNNHGFVTPAVTTLRTPLDAILFVSAYILNLNIVARKRA
jgi:hypothetical protein